MLRWYLRNSYIFPYLTRPYGSRNALDVPVSHPYYSSVLEIEFRVHQWVAILDIMVENVRDDDQWLRMAVTFPTLR